MGQDTTADTELPVAEKSIIAKLSTGCGLGCVGAIAALLLLVAVGYLAASKWVSDSVEEMRTEGFTAVHKALDHAISDTPTDPTVYVGLLVKLTGNYSNDLAIVAGACQIEGTIEGNLFFRGRILEIEKGAVIRKNLNVGVGDVVIDGKVEGRIIGGELDEAY